MYLPIKIKFVNITIFGQYMIKFDWHMTKISRHKTKFNL